jgi:Cu/Ag efflux protein CusF
MGENAMTLRTIRALVIFTVVTTGLTACGGSGGEANSSAEQSDMPGMAVMPGTNGGSDDVATHFAEGTLNSMDLAAGTATISHGPVQSANWPEMTMGFKLADPDSAKSLEPGQRIRFEFTIEGGMSATVTKMEAIE